MSSSSSSSSFSASASAAAAPLLPPLSSASAAASSSSRYHYIASAQKATGVTHAASGHVTGAADVNLVLAKTTHLEILTVTPDGLQPVLDVAINGRIATLLVVRLPVRGCARRCAKSAGYCGRGQMACRRSL